MALRGLDLGLPASTTRRESFSSFCAPSFWGFSVAALRHPCSTLDKCQLACAGTCAKMALECCWGRTPAPGTPPTGRGAESWSIWGLESRAERGQEGPGTGQVGGTGGPEGLGWKGEGRWAWRGVRAGRGEGWAGSRMYLGPRCHLSLLG